MHEADDLDRVIDAALLSYGNPIDGTELSQRILAQVSRSRDLADSRRSVARRKWLPWAIALPLAACLLLFLTLSKSPTHSVSEVKHAGESEEAKSAPNRSPESKRPQATTTHIAAVHSHLARATQSAGERVVARPKLDVFPSPEPLGQQEQALVTLASQPAPPAAQQVLTKTQDDKPLEISAIHIPSIITPDEGKN
jgi:hypothetical protein